MPKVTAAKELRYGGRTIHAGESFEATDKDVNLLRRIGKVGDAPVANLTDVPVDDGDEAKALRAEYAERFGKRPHMGWSPEQLRERMALQSAPEADQTARGYGRRDMRAED